MAKGASGLPLPTAAPTVNTRNNVPIASTTYLTRARGPLSQPGFASLSFHSRRGVIFYALTDRAAAKGRMDALIVTQEQMRALASREDEDNPSDDLRIVSPTVQGFVMMRALSRGPEDLAASAQEAAAMTCAPEPIAEAEK